MQTKTIDDQVWVLQSDVEARIAQLESQIKPTPRSIYVLATSDGALPRCSDDQALFAYPNHRAAEHANQTHWNGELRIAEIEFDLPANHPAK